LGIEDFDANCEFELEVTDDGFLHPIFHSVSMRFGESYFAMDNWFLEFLVW